MVLTRLRMDELCNAWGADRFTPFQIALLGLFDARPFLGRGGGLQVSRIRDELALRAGRVKALGRRVVWTRPGEGLPVWAADPSFDPRQHITVAALPDGAELVTWVANRIVRPLSMDRPLWRAEIIHGLPGEQFALVVVVHHVAADGLTGVALAGSLLDLRPDVHPVAAPSGPVPELPSHRELLRDHLRLRLAGLRRARPPSGRGLRELSRQMREVFAELSTRASTTSLPRTVGPTRALRVVRQPLEELRSAGHALGVTVNDLLLAAVTAGLRQLLTARGEDVDALLIRTSVPAATARGTQASGIMLVDLPMAEADPLRRLGSIHATTARAKQRLRAGPAGVTAVAHLPIPLARLGMRWMRRFGGTRVNLFVTDVPGPPAPLWLAGARMLEAVPVAPLVQHVGLGVAALSYAGELVVSVHADGVVTDLDVLADGISRSLADYRAAAGAAATPATVRGTPG